MSLTTILTISLIVALGIWAYREHALKYQLFYARQKTRSDAYQYKQEIAWRERDLEVCKCYQGNLNEKVDELKNQNRQSSQPRKTLEIPLIHAKFSDEGDLLLTPRFLKRVEYLKLDVGIISIGTKRTELELTYEEKVWELLQINIHKIQNELKY